MALAMALRILEVICQVVTSTCMVVLAFELSPWRRKDKE
jgi:hypothetical protein